MSGGSIRRSLASFTAPRASRTSPLWVNLTPARGSIRVPCNLLYSTADDRSLPQVPAPGLRRGRRPGGGRPDAEERDRARADPAGVPLRRAARDGQAAAPPTPRQGLQLRAGADAGAGRALPLVPRDRSGHLAGR